MQEIWKSIKGYESLYEVSNFGRVKSLLSNQILKPIDSHGYKYVHLCNENHIRKNYALHRLVAKAFLINKDNFNQVNHKDGNKANNQLTNLEWCNQQYNNIHKINVLNKSNRRKIICIETKTIFDSIKEAANYYHKDQSTLVSVLRGYKYNHTFAGYHWKYME